MNEKGHMQREVESCAAIRHRRPKKIFRYPKKTQSYTTARGEFSNSDTPAGPSNQSIIVKNEGWCTAFLYLIWKKGGATITRSYQTKEPRQLGTGKCGDSRSYRVTSQSYWYGLLCREYTCQACFPPLRRNAINRFGTTVATENVIRTSFERWNQSEMLVY